MKMIEDTIKRINELARKSKAEGLTPEELQEQQVLRREYIEAFKRNMRGTLNNISIKEADGSITANGETIKKITIDGKTFSKFREITCKY